MSVAVRSNEARIAANGQLVAAVEADLQVQTDLRRGVIDQRQDLFEDAPSESRAVALEEKATEISLVDAEIANLRRDLTSAQSAIRQDETAIITLRATPPGELLSSATIPAAPDGISRSLLLAAGALLGLVLGLVVAFFIERLDTTARDEEDVALALGTSVIGAIPTLGIGNRRGSHGLIMFSTGGSARIAAAREAFRRLRGSLLFLNRSSGVSSVVVTSSAPAEG